MLMFGDATRFVDPLLPPSVSPSPFVHVVDPDSPRSLSPIDFDDDTMTTLPCLSSIDSPLITMPLKGEDNDEEINGFIKSNTLKRRSTTTFSSSCGRITPIRENRTTTTTSGGGTGLGVVFDKNVSVILIPTRKEYPSELRNSLWLDRKEHKINKARNLIEFEAEGFDWRNVMDDDDMVYNPTCGNFIHPIHYGHQWFHMTCQMSKQKQQFYNEIIMKLPKPTPVRPTAPTKKQKKNKTKKQSSEEESTTSSKKDEESKSSESEKKTKVVQQAKTGGMNNFIPHFVSSCNALPFPF